MSIILQGRLAVYKATLQILIKNVTLNNQDFAYLEYKRVYDPNLAGMNWLIQNLWSEVPFRSNLAVIRNVNLERLKNILISC